MSFLEEVEEMAGIHSLDDSDLLTGVGSLLGGSAKSWYKSTKDRLYSWDAFKKCIREAFMPEDCDDKILDLLRKMRQRDNETFVVYAGRMEQLFNRLESPLEERREVRMLINDLHLYYRTKICEDEIQTKTQLRRACQKWERAKADIMRREKEKERADRGEREKKTERIQEEKNSHRGDTSRKLTKTFQVDEIAERREQFDEPFVEAVSLNPGRGPGKAMQCWRCGRYGHFAMQCTEDIYCVSCGKRGEIAERCPQCVHASAQGLWNLRPSRCPQQVSPDTFSKNVGQPLHPSFFPFSPETNFESGAWEGRNQVPANQVTPPPARFPPPVQFPPPGYQLGGPPLQPQQMQPRALLRHNARTPFRMQPSAKD